MCARDLQPDVVPSIMRGQNREITGKSTDLLERTAEEGGEPDALTDVSLTPVMTIDHCRLRHLTAPHIEKPSAHRQQPAENGLMQFSCFFICLELIAHRGGEQKVRSATWLSVFGFVLHISDFNHKCADR